jgi:hypothetical protein
MESNIYQHVRTIAHSASANDTIPGSTVSNSLFYLSFLSQLLIFLIKNDKFILNVTLYSRDIRNYLINISLHVTTVPFWTRFTVHVTHPRI